MFSLNHSILDGLAHIQPLLPRVAEQGTRYLRKRTGYSGSESRPHVRPSYVRSSHLTAKTHQTVHCLAITTAAAALRGDIARKGLLKERAARRAERNV